MNNKNKNNMIQHPITNKWVSVDSISGKKIIKNYSKKINQLGGVGSDDTNQCCTNCGENLCNNSYMVEYMDFASRTNPSPDRTDWEEWMTRNFTDARSNWPESLSIGQSKTPHYLQRPGSYIIPKLPIIARFKHEGNGRIPSYCDDGMGNSQSNNSSLNNIPFSDFKDEFVLVTSRAIGGRFNIKKLNLKWPTGGPHGEAVSDRNRFLIRQRQAPITRNAGTFIIMDKLRFLFLTREGRDYMNNLPEISVPESWSECWEAHPRINDRHNVNMSPYCQVCLVNIVYDSLQPRVIGVDSASASGNDHGNTGAQSIGPYADPLEVFSNYAKDPLRNQMFGIGDSYHEALRRNLAINRDYPITIDRDRYLEQTIRQSQEGDITPTPTPLIFGASFHHPRTLTTQGELDTWYSNMRRRSLEIRQPINISECVLLGNQYHDLGSRICGTTGDDTSSPTVSPDPAPTVSPAPTSETNEASEFLVPRHGDGLRCCYSVEEIIQIPHIVRRANIYNSIQNTPNTLATFDCNLVEKTKNEIRNITDPQDKLNRIEALKEFLKDGGDCKLRISRDIHKLRALQLRIEIGLKRFVGGRIPINFVDGTPLGVIINRYNLGDQWIKMIAEGDENIPDKYFNPSQPADDPLKFKAYHSGRDGFGEPEPIISLENEKFIEKKLAKPEGIHEDAVVSTACYCSNCLRLIQPTFKFSGQEEEIQGDSSVYVCEEELLPPIVICNECAVTYGIQIKTKEEIDEYREQLKTTNNREGVAETIAVIESDLRSGEGDGTGVIEYHTNYSNFIVMYKHIIAKREAGFFKHLNYDYFYPQDVLGDLGSCCQPTLTPDEHLTCIAEDLNRGDYLDNLITRIKIDLGIQDNVDQLDTTISTGD